MLNLQDNRIKMEFIRTIYLCSIYLEYSMNREIKFRFFNPILGMSINILELGEFYFSDFDKLKIMEYTGLKDINGKDIYEGDIIKYSYIQGFGTKIKVIIAEVIFKDGCFGVWENSNWWNNNLKDEENIEIIGNIFENPKLLEKVNVAI